MLTKIQKWGNSQGIRFPKEILREANIDVGDDVSISVKRGEIVVKPSKVTRGKYDLKTLLAKMPDNYKSEEVNWGDPQGKEVW
ncbi:MAG: AbrB/MazE/SpoVT family DNA-binding domain-containing protein [Thermodesulfobacteriota bacterium]|nr:AbrB/MazE/SpoVT family DNA-binding domain-containing protein [Thermodesulfobacteriota bacterium]